MKRITNCLLLIVALVGAAPSAFALPYSGFYVFGDSLSDLGNVADLTGGSFPPSPFYVDGRFSNGPVAAEYLADSLGLNALQVFNFAHGGATTGTLNTNSAVTGLVLPGLATQIQDYSAGLLSSGMSADADALYMVWAGPNNFLGGVSDPAAAIAQAVGDLAAAITTLAVLGAETIFVPNMPNLGATPATLATGDPTRIIGATLLSMGFNSVLASTLASLDAVLPAQILSFDVFALTNAVVANPGDFGFTNVKQSCVALDFSSICANPNQYLFWDGIHPTTQGHMLLAQNFLSVLVPAPGTLSLLAGGFLLLVAMRRSAHTPSG